MTRKTDQDLLGLFSTRERSGSRPSQGLTNQDRSGGTGTSNTTSGPASAPQARNDAMNVNVRADQDDGGTRYGISSVARAVMREARKELGGHDMSIGSEIAESDIARAVDRVCASRGFTVTDVTRADIIVNLKRDLLGWGVLQPLIDNADVTDIHCYDYQTVVLQRGKKSELTNLGWPSHETYSTFIDRLLFRVGKSLSTQQHTIDASFPDGTRLCAVHSSVCGARGPLLTIRIPRVYDTTLESLIAYQVAPPLMVSYLAALTRSGEYTMIVSGETGTGKTTLMRCLGTQFRLDESIVGVEDTPELNYKHPFYRSLVSRTANTEGMGEVTLQEHIKTTLRLTPSRVILGEMRTPEAAEAFLESAQTGHTGMATIHARNSRETLTRLESLLGRSQRGVAMEVIRQQISLAVAVVVWMTRERVSGRVRIGEISEVGHLVEGNIQFRPMFRLAEEGDNPRWEVLSWSTYFNEALDAYGVFLGDAPQHLSLGQLPSSY